MIEVFHLIYSKLEGAWDNNVPSYFVSTHSILIHLCISKQSKIILRIKRISVIYEISPWNYIFAGDGFALLCDQPCALIARKQRNLTLYVGKVVERCIQILHCHWILWGRANAVWLPRNYEKSGSFWRTMLNVYLGICYAGDMISYL